MKIQYLDKHGLGTVLKLLKKRTSDVYVIKGSGIYADAAFLALAADAKEAIAEGASAINAAGLWQRKAGVWTQITDVQPGWVYSIKNSFITDAQFVEGADYKVADGTNIVVVNEGTEDAPVLKWDLLARTLDLDEYQKKLLETPLEVFDNETPTAYADHTLLPTSEPAATATITDLMVAVMGAGAEEGDVYRAHVAPNETDPTVNDIVWVKLGNQLTVEGALEFLGSTCPNTPITDAEIEDIFNSL